MGAGWMCRTDPTCLKWLDLDHLASLNGFDRGGENFLGRQAVGALTVDLFGVNTGAHLLEEAVDAVFEGGFEAVHPAEDRVGVDGFFQAAGREEGDLLEHVLDEEAPAGTGHLAAFHWVAALDVIAAGEGAHRAAGEAHVEGGGRPERASRGNRGEAVHFADVPAEVAHDVDGVGVEGLDLEEGRAFGGVLDPHAHIAEEQVAQAALVDPFARQAVGRVEAVVHVGGQTDAFLAGFGDHFLGQGDGIADGFFTQDVAAKLQSLHHRAIVVTAVFHPGCADADQVRLEPVEHVLSIQEARHAQTGGGSLGALG